ncbi:MAG: plastocyanin/azurin family copper-binding protein [Halobacteriales archaeon]
MRRREFLRVSSGAAAATAVGSGAASAQESGGEGSGSTVQVDLVDFAFEPGTEEPLTIPPGTIVKFVWQTSNHNINVDSKPDGSDWEGHKPIESQGFTHKHTFEVTGEYHFWCDPHRGLGMIGDIVVEEGASVPGAGGEGGGVPEEVDPEEMGVPFQAHFVGLATILGIVISLVFTFYLLKYGESPHSGYPKR